MGLNRFYVLECDRIIYQHGPSHVIDRAHNHIVIDTYNTRLRGAARAPFTTAQEHADHLNQVHP